MLFNFYCHCSWVMPAWCSVHLMLSIIVLHMRKQCRSLPWMPTKLSHRIQTRKGDWKLKDKEAWDAYCSLPPTHFLISSLLSISGILWSSAPLFVGFCASFLLSDLFMDPAPFCPQWEDSSVQHFNYTKYSLSNLLMQEAHLQKTCRVRAEWSQTRLDLAQISEDCLNPSAKLDQTVKRSLSWGQLQKTSWARENFSLRT